MGSIFVSTQETGGTTIKKGVNATTAMSNPVQYDFGSAYNDAKFPPNTDFLATTVSASGHLYQGANYVQNKTSITVNQGVSGGPISAEV